MSRPLSAPELARFCEAVGAEAARVARVGAAAEALFAQTPHLHGLTKTMRPLLGVAAAVRQAARRGRLRGAMRACLPALTPFERRLALGAAGEPAAAQDGGNGRAAAEREAARRMAALLALAEAATLSGAQDATFAAALDDGRELELLVTGGGAVRESVAAVKAAAPVWNAAMARPLRTAALHAGKTLPSRMAPEATLAALARRTLQTHWEAFAARLYGLGCRDDIEFVHELRVALRRLRAALRVFKAAIDGLARALLGELKRLADALGHVRDADVFLAFLRRRAAEAPEEQRPFLRGLELAERRKRGRFLRTLRDTFESAEFAAFRERFDPVLTGRTAAGGLCALAKGEEPAAAHAPKALAKRLRSAARLGRGLARASAARQHALRIACKKLRYTAEFFAALYPHGLAAVIEPMALMQDALGDVHDADVYRERVIRYHTYRKAEAHEPATARAVDALLEFLEAQRADALGRAVDVWRSFTTGKKARKAIKAIL
ncbi:MAG TPA: CHAD domain-containing protein [Planctomycetota bacterium]|nr:CHAD domain-containing protein [Planctomycetota bacterium]HRR82569.1 CHAD domain-containing protein [Planctomycetota bacterium]HRT95394.1 CHAD domain-containing protein [Planctomycetota bacterium]